MSEHARGEMKYFTNLHLLVGFSDLQINQVLENCHKLFSITEICSNIEIWHMEHAHKILNIINEVFGDVCEVQVEDWDNDDMELEDAIDHALQEWAPPY